MGKTYVDRAEQSRFARHATEFRCKHCRMMVLPPQSGGHNRNHCPFCLWSRHVDGKTPGDRASTCGSMMEPIGRREKSRGEPVLVHRCLRCGLERYNRVAADDDWVLLESLSGLDSASSTAMETDALV